MTFKTGMRMQNTVGKFAALGFILLLAACSGVKDNVFVLLEEPDGSIGSVEISNDQGSQTIDERGESVGMDSAGRAPSEPRVLEAKVIREIFDEALEAEPEPPVTFILHFKRGGTELTPESEAILDDIQAEVARRASPNVEVVGHTDRTGASDFNYTLALDRARLLRDILVESGLDPGLVEVSSHGEANPVVPTEDEVSQPLNRRVEATVR